METQICNFADDNTAFGCVTSIDIVAKKFEGDMPRIQGWFKIKSMVVKASK